ncbi:hypothetical protein ACLOJK_027056 [Asimina triloba]
MGWARHGVELLKKMKPRIYRGSDGVCRRISLVDLPPPKSRRLPSDLAAGGRRCLLLLVMISKRPRYCPVLGRLSLDKILDLAMDVEFRSDLGVSDLLSLLHRICLLCNPSTMVGSMVAHLGKMGHRNRCSNRPIRAGFIAVVHLKSGKRRERSESDGTSLRPVPTACNGRATLGRVGGEGKSHLERSHGIQPGCCCCHQEEGEIVSLSRASSDLPLALVVVSSSCSPASHRRQGTPSPGVLPLSPCFHPSPLAPPPTLPGSLSPLAVPPLSPPISPSPPPSSASLLPVPPPAPPKTYLSLHSLSPLLSSSARPSSLSPRISPSPPPSSLSRPLLPLRHFLRSPLLPLSPDPSLLRLPPPSLPGSTPSASLLPPPSLPIYALRLPPPSTPSRPLLPLFSSSPCSLRLPPTPPAPCSLRFSSSASLRPLPPPALSALLSPPPAPPLLFLPLFPPPPALSASLPPPPSASLRPLPPPAPPLLFLPLLPPPPSPCSPSSPPSPCSPSSPPPPAPSALSRLLLPLLSSSAPCSLLPRSRSTPSASRLPPPPPALVR